MKTSLKKTILLTASAVLVGTGLTCAIKNTSAERIDEIENAAIEKGTIIEKGAIIELTKENISVKRIKYNEDHLVIDVTQPTSNNAVIQMFNSYVNEEFKVLIKKETDKEKQISITQSLRTEKYTEQIFSNYMYIKIKDENGAETFKQQVFFTDTSGKVLNLSDFIEVDKLSVFNQLLINKGLPTMTFEDAEMAIIDTKVFTVFKTDGTSVDLEMKDVKLLIKEGFCQKQIALTFDDGPSPVTPHILDVLEKYDAKATFFVLGKNTEYYPDIVKRAEDEGHEIASHSWNHENFTKLNMNQMKENLEKTSNAIEKASGESPILFRPPYGAYNDTVKQVAESSKEEITLWNVDTMDWKSRNAEKIKQHIISHAKDGNVVLMHDLYPTTKEGLEAALDVLSKQGYTFVTINNLY